MVIFSTNLLMYVFFGVFLIVLSLALYDRLKSGAPAIMQVATAIGIIWAGSLIASGMVANAGIAPVVALYAKDPAQAALTWQGIESVANGLGNGNGEILGGLWTLLVSLAALRAGGLPKGLNILGLLVGAVGIISHYPRVDRPDDRSFWLEPDHLVRLAGDCAAAQQSGQDSVESRWGAKE